jgi:hypothetical protein
VANFGVLTRQRSQLLPFLVILLVLPGSRNRTSPPPSGPPVLVDAHDLETQRR